MKKFVSLQHKQERFSPILKEGKTVMSLKISDTAWFSTIGDWTTPKQLILATWETINLLSNSNSSVFYLTATIQHNAYASYSKNICIVIGRRYFLILGIQMYIKLYETKSEEEIHI